MPPTPPPTDLSWPIPKLKLRIDDLDHDGVRIFLNAVNPKETLRKAVMMSFKWLYTLETVPRSVEEITLILTSMPGVAHTTGSKTHKEIYYSLEYILATQARAEEEISGVLVHEVVHCFQHTGQGSCPGGLIEGIADYVRLKAGCGPPHWVKKTSGHWNAGYESTAYFLDWIERRHGKGVIRKLNGEMKERRFEEGLFQELTGEPLNTLWQRYCGSSDELLVSPNPEEELEVKISISRGHWLPTEWPLPRFNIRVEDLGHAGVDVFYDAVKPMDVLHRAVMASFNWLYTLDTVPRDRGKVEEILLVLRPMNGVAHTTGSATHKEIHFSLDYIKYSGSRAREEITGVIVHEVVHCYQHTGSNTCPGGLIEGIADFVRLSENLGPPHWNQWDTPDRWDAGYQSTAYFLEWMESITRKGFVRDLNARLKDVNFDHGLFEELAGRTLGELWSRYGQFQQEELAKRSSAP